jgi:hypothetical protein
VSELLGSLKIHESVREQIGRINDAGRPLYLVQRPLGGFGGKGKSSRAKPGAKTSTEIPHCPTIAMNAGEFGRANQSDHHVL